MANCTGYKSQITVKIKPREKRSPYVSAYLYEDGLYSGTVINTSWSNDDSEKTFNLSIDEGSNDTNDYYRLRFYGDSDYTDLGFHVYDDAGNTIKKFIKEGSTTTFMNVYFNICEESNPPSMISDVTGGVTFESTCENLIKDCTYSESNYNGALFAFEHLNGKDVLWDPENEDFILFSSLYNIKILINTLRDILNKL